MNFEQASESRAPGGAPLPRGRGPEGTDGRGVGAVPDVQRLLPRRRREAGCRGQLHPGLGLKRA